VTVAGTVRVPGDKSISHRALILGALATGAGRVRGILDSADVRATAGVLRALGADVPAVAPDMTVRGRGTRSLRASDRPLDCANSGTSARLMAGVLAAHPFSSTLVGDASLSRRPMQRVAQPLAAMGASFELAPGGTLPMTVHGAELSSVEYTSETASAQVKSAVLLAALVAGVEVTFREPVRSRDHTERMLAARGVEVWVNEQAVMLWPTAGLPPADVEVPGDPSSAAFFVALAAMSGNGSVDLPDVCLNETRIGFLAAMARMGANLDVQDERQSGGEPVGRLVVRGGALRGVRVGDAEVPSLIDELPLLACVAAHAEGETEIRGAAELRVKESDRIATVVANLRAVGADADELPDGMVVRGADRPLRGRVRAHADHRIAMAFAILGARPGNAIEVDDPACVDVSYPSFWRDLARVTGAP
jgi:3-phosphoshikimate 1-carboxyvinyltransferase